MTDQEPKQGRAAVVGHNSVHFLFEQEDLPEPWEKDEYYEAFIDYKTSNIWPDHPVFQALVDRIYTEANIASLIEATSPKAIQTATERRKVELASLLWHCYLIFRNDFTSSDPRLLEAGMIPTHVEGHPTANYVEFSVYPFIKISLNKNDYRVNDPENPRQITDNVARILRLLYDSGFVEFQSGYFDKDKGLGKQTRFRPDRKLDLELDYLPPLQQPALPKPNPSSFRMAVKPKGTKKSKKEVWQDVEFSPICPELQEHAELVDRYNGFVETQKLRLHGSRKGILWLPSADGEFKAVQEANIYIRNVYHVEDNGGITYGRMHGGFWQNMPSKYRHLIRINGEPVVILDFKAMILSIVASHSGQKLIGDPYEIDVGLGDQHKKVQRSLIKSILIIGINTKSSIEAANAVLNEHASSYREAFGRKLTQKAVLGFIDKIVQTHPFLKTYLFKKLGKDIFAIDADIARGIIRRCLDADKLVLPIHDGFVVAQSDKDFLRSAMEASWKDFFDTDIGIDEE